MRRFAAELVIVSAIVGTATAQAAAPLQKHTRADTAAAERASLTLGDLGLGWKETASAGPESALTCASWHPDLTGVVETGSASSSTFQAGSRGPFASESAWVYKTPAQAALVWKRVVAPKLLSCLASSVAAASTKDVKFTVGSKQVIHSPSSGKQRASYRVVATAATAGGSSKTYYDLVLVGAGRGLAEMTFARIGAPMSSATEAGVAKRVAGRLAAIPLK